MREAPSERRETRDKRRETRDERRETRDERQATSDERRETRDKRRKDDCGYRHTRSRRCGCRVLSSLISRSRYLSSLIAVLKPVSAQLSCADLLGSPHHIPLVPALQALPELAAGLVELHFRADVAAFRADLGDRLVPGDEVTILVRAGVEVRAALLRLALDELAA